MKKILFWGLLCLILFSNAYILDANPTRILIGSPVYQKPGILNEFLESLKRLNNKGIVFDYYFVDDNDLEESHLLLQNFSKAISTKCILFKSRVKKENDGYLCDETTHYWTDQTIWKVAGFKNQIIDYALKNAYDYLFLIDSDVVLHPDTIQQLLKANKDIVSNIFWTRWRKEQMEYPQVWLYDVATFYEKKHWEVLSSEEILKRMGDFFSMLRKPGVYEVGGLGACTLISRRVLEKGVNFDKMPNLSYWGEDRHFCTKAIALDFELFVDTHFPAYHIYRESELTGVSDFVMKCEKTSSQIVSSKK